MEQEEIVLCGSSAYTKKFYLNPLFNGLPEGIKEDLNILSASGESKEKGVC